MATANIVVQIKQVGKTVVSPVGGNTVIAQIKQVGKTIVGAPASVTSTDQVARAMAAGAFEKANGAVQTGFVTVNVSGEANVVADSNTDTLTLVAGAGIIITTDATNDSITVIATGLDATDQFARDQANSAFNKANGAIFTAAQIRANLSNTTPINYDSTTGVISHADSSVIPGTYGNTTFVPTVTVDIKGHVTTITNTAIALPPSTDEFARAQANAAFNKANAAAQNSFTTITIANQSSVVADSNTDTLTLVAGNGISITTNSIADSITVGLSQTETLTFDDFISGGYTSFSAIGGKLGWYNSPSGSGAIRPIQEEEHPGIVKLSTGAVSGSHAWMYIPGDSRIPGFVKFRDKWNVQCVVKLVSIDSGAQTAISMGSSIGYGGEYIRFEKLFADSNVFAVCSNGTQTRVDVLSPVANTWYRFGIRKERGNTENVVFSINGADVATMGASLPSAASSLSAQFLIDTNALADKQLWVDYWQAITGNTLPTGLGVR